MLSMDCINANIRILLIITHMIYPLHPTEGHAVLWRGLWSAIVRAVPVNAVTFAMYEVALSVFKGFGAESEE